MIWIDHLTGHLRLTLGTDLNNYLDSGFTPLIGTWQHVAATYDGVTARFYIDGTEVANTVYTGNVGDSNTWRIGAYDSTSSGFFDGSIDNVRIYDRALSAGEIQTDMASRIQPPDTTPPSAPGTLTAGAGVSQATLNWTAASDNFGVVAYNVHRSTTAGFTPGPATQIARVTGLTYTDTALAGGTYYYKVTAEDAAGNIGIPSNEASVNVAADNVQPTVSITAPTGTVSDVVNVTANASDNVGVAGVQFRIDGKNLGAEDTVAPYSTPWDTRGELNGTHTVSAVARDAVGNQRTSANVTVTVTNAGVSETGLRASYNLDEGTGTLALDSSINNNNATLVGATWTTTGRYGGAVALNGTSAEVDPPALGAFYGTGVTLEAWVYKQSTKPDAGIIGSWVASQGGGIMIWVDPSGRYKLTLGNTLANYLDSGRSPAIGQWQHVAATYDGSVARFYVDGAQTATTTFSGSVGTSNTWRIGAYDSPAGGFLDGQVDNVRIYDRALSASEIQVDMASRIQGDKRPPTVAAFTPSAGATEINVGTTETATFSEPMVASTITANTVKLTDSANNNVQATVTYDPATRTATLTPKVALLYGTSYTLTVKGGSSGVSDLAGNRMAADATATFKTETAPGPVVILTSSGNPFSKYLGEILRVEGLNEFTTLDVNLATPAALAPFDVALLGQTSLTNAQVTTLTGWVNAGGNLIAMRPDKKLAPLLGLTDAPGSLSNGYLKVDTTKAPGQGIVGSTIQFHGAADKFTVSGATVVAPLYSNAATATSNPAVTLRSVGSSGGQAAAFTYDLALSVSQTRQGNPAWVGMNRDGEGIAPDDLFFGGGTTPDWVDTTRIAIPQADEQQRLLANLITTMARDQLPVPRFWYLPRGLKAAVALTSDDHSLASSQGGTAFRFDRLKALSTPGCVVANWECVRATGFIYPDDALTNAQATGYINDGFDIGLHPLFGACPTTVQTSSQISSTMATQLNLLRAKYTGVPSPVSNRNHCYYWPDWSTMAKVEAANGMRLDMNYAHYPAAWIGNKPGFMTGSGFPMRFADSNGTPIDVYQADTHLADDGTTVAQTPAFIAALLDNALGSNGYYGAFGVLVHADDPQFSQQVEDVVAAAKARNVPIISDKQLLQWTDARNNSMLDNLVWNAGKLTFDVIADAGANGLQAMLPTQGPSGTLATITSNGASVPFTTQTIKGIPYAFFGAATGTYTATYA
jgi:hypothetical protein